MNTRRNERGIAIATILIIFALIVGTAAPTLAAGQQPPTSFLISGHVFYENSSDCNNPNVNITNLNSGTMWQAETYAGSNRYQLTLCNDSDITVGQILQFNATSPDGGQINVTTQTITQQELNDGGLFNFNISLAAMAMLHDINVSTDYQGAVNGIKITDDETVVGPDENLTSGKAYNIRYKLVNEGDFNETSIAVTVKAFNESWNETIGTHSYSLNIGISKTYKDTWNTSGLAPGEYNITVNASIPDDANPDDNERTRSVTLGTEEPIYDVSITSEPMEQTTAPGVNANYTLTITNNGNVADTIKLNITENEADNGTLSADTFELNASETATAYLNVNDSEAGTYNTTVRATSEGNATVYEEVSIETEVTAPTEVATISIGDATASPGETTTVLMRIYNATNAGVVNVNLTYNQSIIRVINVTGSDFDFIMANLEHNDTGIVRIGAIQMANPGLNGTVTIANVTLEAVGSYGHSSPLNISVKEFKDATPGANDLQYEVSNGTFYWNGDANGDGEVTLLDATYLAQSVLGITGYEAIAITSDVNGDGVVTLADAMYLAKHVLGIPGYEKLK